jgi:hypothetical protein
LGRLGRWRPLGLLSNSVLITAVTFTGETGR